MINWPSGIESPPAGPTVAVNDAVGTIRVIFDPDPGFTTVVQHNVTSMPNAIPCRQTPYRLSPDKTRRVNAHIQSLLKYGIIEESLSPWSA